MAHHKRSLCPGSGCVITSTWKRVCRGQPLSVLVPAGARGPWSMHRWWCGLRGFEPREASPTPRPSVTCALPRSRGLSSFGELAAGAAGGDPSPLTLEVRCMLGYRKTFFIFRLPSQLFFLSFLLDSAIFPQVRSTCQIPCLGLTSQRGTAMVLAQEGEGKGRHVQSISAQPRCARTRCCGKEGRGDELSLGAQA